MVSINFLGIYKNVSMTTECHNFGLQTDPLYHGEEIQTIHSMRGIRGGRRQGVRTQLKNHKHIGFLINTGLDPLENKKSYQASIQCWAIIGPQ